MSISQAKYMAMSYGIREDIWIWRLLNKPLPEQAIRKMIMLDDNKTSFTLTKDPESLNCTKHIDIMHYHISRLVENRELGIK